jgi:hypothetical protein
MANKSRESAFINRRNFLKLPLAAGALVATSNLTAQTGTSQATPETPIKALTSQERMKLVENSWRTFEFGFAHSPSDTFDKLDPEWFMENLRKAGAQVVILETKGHFGLAWYPTPAARGRRGPA